MADILKELRSLVEENENLEFSVDESFPNFEIERAIKEIERLRDHVDKLEERLNPMTINWNLQEYINLFERIKRETPATDDLAGNPLKWSITKAIKAIVDLRNREIAAAIKERSHG